MEIMDIGTYLGARKAAGETEKLHDGCTLVSTNARSETREETFYKFLRDANLLIMLPTESLLILGQC